MILSAILVQLMHQPMVETRKRKKLHDNPIASWELRAGKYRIFYEVDEASQKVTIIAASYKEHNTLFIRGRRGADMKTVDLAQQKLEIEELINLARQEPVLLLTSGSEEFYVSEADDFEKEVEALRNSQAFQQFFDERSKDKRTIPLEELEKRARGGTCSAGKTSLLLKRFDLIFHPVSNVFVPDVKVVWKECYRVLRSGGLLLTGFMNPMFFLFNHEEAKRAGSYR